MEITLISGDSDLCRLCREVLVEARRPSWTLSVVGTYAYRPASDYYIWDFDSKTSLSACPDLSPSKNLFLVDREELGRFRKSAGHGATVNILLKPVTRDMLAAFLDIAFEISSGKMPHQRQWNSAECFLQTSLRLQKHDQDRSNFIAGLAHDLRTPATALVGYSGLLLDEGQGCLDENQRNILQHMQNSANRLSRMVSEIFDLSVESQRARSVHLRRADVLRCLDQALHEIAPFAVDKQIAIQTQIESFEGNLYFDRGLIERVLINILENACRFTPREGRIEIHGYPFFWERRNANVVMPALTECRSSVRNAPNSYRVDIRNSGAAIPSEMLDRIFEQYIGSESAREHQGCGLGLAICRTILARHRGRIWAANTELGPEFSFVLPGGYPQPSSSGRAREDRYLNDATPLANELVNYDAAI